MNNEVEQLFSYFGCTIGFWKQTTENYWQVAKISWLVIWSVGLQSPTKRQFWFLEWLMIYCGGVGTNLQLWPDLPNQASGQGQNSDRSRFWCYRPPPMIDARHQRLVKSCLKAMNLYLIIQAYQRFHCDCRWNFQSLTIFSLWSIGQKRIPSSPWLSLLVQDHRFLNWLPPIAHSEEMSRKLRS